MENLFQKTCSNCGAMKFKSWEQLNDDEKIVVEKLFDDSVGQKELQQFCKRCLYAHSNKNMKDI